MKVKEIHTPFDIHYDQLEEKQELAQQKLQSSVPTSSNDIIDWALWLWAIAEQVERFEDTFLLEEYEQSIQEGISFLQNKWDTPQSNVWDQLNDQIHTSTLGMVYAALLGLKNIGYTSVQPTITSLRDSIFQYHLDGGMLVRSREIKEVSTDLLYTVMPFGLFSPEDLVMVEAVKEMEDRLVTKEGVYRYRGDTQPSSESALMLSWYFYEKGTTNKAKMYFDIAEKTPEKPEYYNTLKSIVLVYMEEQLKQDEITIHHQPYGNDNPYDQQVFERKPRNPEVGDNVYVFNQVHGVEKGEEIDVHLKVQQGEDIRVIPSTLKELQGDEVWEAPLGDFETLDPVMYWFEATVKGKKVKSDIYHFKPLKKYGLTRIHSYYEDKNILWLQGDTTYSGKSIYMYFEKQGSQFGITIDAPEINLLKIESEDLHFTLQNYSVTVQEQGKRIQLYKGDQVFLQSYPEETFPLVEWLQNEDGFVHQVCWNFHSPLEERFFGLGERYHKLEYRGDEIDCYVYNQYRDQGSRTYIPVPFYISSEGYGLHLKTEHYSVFDFAHHFSDRLHIRCDIASSTLNQKFNLFIGNPKQVVASFTEETGEAVLPPVWAFGPWMSSNNWDRDSIVREQVKQTNDLQIPSTVLVMEQWSDEATYYIFNDAEYEVKPGNEVHRYDDYHFPKWGRWPDPKGLMEYLHDNGLKAILWQIPIQKYLNRQHHPQKDNDEAFMIEQGYTVKDEDGNPYRMPEGWFKESLLMDFTNPNGSKWWFDKRKYLLDIGVDGFKTDGGEFVFGRNTTFYNGSTGHDMRNQYPNDYIEAYYRFATDYHNGDALTFSRAGYTGAQTIPAHWAGDERSTFDAFRNSLIAGLSSGISGISMWGWDLAGFNGDIPTVELFIRSAQMAAFCPIMQYHAESKAEFNQDRTPWNIADRTGDERAISGYRYYANLRMNLLPYIYEQARKATRTGVPLMKSLFMEYPDDTKVYDIFDQYFFGENLMVAPIIQEGAEEREVYFPEGEWIHLFTNESITGPCYRKVKASFMDIPVYVKKGTILVSNLSEELKWGSWVGNDTTAYEVPTLHLYPGKELSQCVSDHLGNEWKVKIDENRVINVVGIEETRVIITKHLDHYEKVTLNGYPCEKLERENDSIYYV
ncbi:TIM-barrel domain-containing protein [Pontibacillus sp. HMF3514]|uniref:TIM-barrel domain-containing protein n=1 Tax=Pontibacillus sp. HMF3514 TaxID=2692425 RepID=UPI00131F547B|nr:TIM-barrel domain-containing protein [Pontibacillus sp. HMF3514]QHE51800.1 glycoside hydrolase family 31 protein [Pontibacillus sp. HMF3514]